MIGWWGDGNNSLRHQWASEVFKDLRPAENFKELDAGASAVLVSEDRFAVSAKEMSFFNQALGYLQFADGFLRENDQWVPECSYLSVFQKMLAASSAFIDIKKSVMVVGDFIPSRAALLALYKIGFRDFLILKEESAGHWLFDVQKGLFGLQVKEIGVRDLVNLSGDSSVLVHAVASKEKVLAEWELSYMNFLSRPGLIIDFLDESFLEKVVEETHDKDLHLLDRKDIEKESLEWWRLKTGA
jgi:hypothetical protein